ncbi:MAG: AraC family transcriptional regulator [Opitutaceae bacterium]|nr:AraC family transcriptional regulator [Opitutaceae bacterium]MBP9902132.1 AraC family transcriptional regulator [Verrucomicrobiota bacterium]
MPAWSPILVQKIEIHALGFVLRKLQLNRHRETEVALHGHAYAQLILYLSGEGVQTIGQQRHQARSGDLFIIPAGLSHGYSVSGRSRPVCLVLDYESENTEAARTRIVHRRLNPAALNELSEQLARVPRKGRLTLGDYPAILAVVARLLGQTSPPATPAKSAPAFAKVRALLETPAPLSVVARQAGYHPDHLTRKLKRETGLGLRATRDRLRLAAAQQALHTESTIAEAAVKAGFDDPNYFSRWYRRQTGQTPTAFSRT